MTGQQGVRARKDRELICGHRVKAGDLTFGPKSEFRVCSQCAPAPAPEPAPKPKLRRSTEGTCGRP